MNSLQKLIGNCIKVNYHTDKLDEFVSICKKYKIENRSIGSLTVMFDTFINNNMDLLKDFIVQNFNNDNMKFISEVFKENKEIAAAEFDVNLIDFLNTVYTVLKGNINRTTFWYDHCLYDIYKYYMDKRNSLKRPENYSECLEELIWQIASIINSGTSYNPDNVKTLINYAFDNLEEDSSLY